MKNITAKIIRVKRKVSRERSNCLDVNKYSPAAEEILYHHQDWCPQNNSLEMSGTEIPSLARILHVIDYYMQAVYLEDKAAGLQGTKELSNFSRQESGQKFDSQVVKKMIGILN